MPRVNKARLSISFASKKCIFKKFLSTQGVVGFVKYAPSNINFNSLLFLRFSHTKMYDKSEFSPPINTWLTPRPPYLSTKNILIKLDSYSFFSFTAYHFANNFIFVLMLELFSQFSCKVKYLFFFLSDQVSRQISRTCWDHAKALTCRKFYPECNVRRTEPDMRPLCPSHCDYVKEICKGEYARTLHSGFYQQYFPLCSSTTFFPDEICWKLPTYNPSEGGCGIYLLILWNTNSKNLLLLQTRSFFVARKAQGIFA